jgi:hypothetical protein
MDGDPYGPYPETAERMFALTDEGRQRRLLNGEANRLEQSMMGIYAVFPDSHNQLEDYEPNRGAKATGLQPKTIKKVMRWFLGLPEPGCSECERVVRLMPDDAVAQRCSKHQGW